MKINRKQVQLIQVAKGKVGMTRPEYEALLESFGVESSTDLKVSDMDAVMQRFGALGFDYSGGYKPVRSSKELLLGKISAMKNDLGLHDAYINGIANKMNFGVSHYRFCTAQQLHKIVAALSFHAKRKKEAAQ